MRGSPDVRVSYLHLAGDPCQQPEQLSAESSNIHDCTKQETYDYFSGSAWPYIVSFTVLGLSLLRTSNILPNYCTNSSSNAPVMSLRCIVFIFLIICVLSDVIIIMLLFVVVVVVFVEQTFIYSFIQLVFITHIQANI